MRNIVCGNIGLPIIVTAGSSYLDMDAYACCVAMCELLNRGGVKSIAFSRADYNYSVCQSLITKDSMYKSIPPGYQNAKYMVVDVSDPVFIMDAVPLEQVITVYDHHVGFEEFWKSRIGDHAHIECIGAAATLIYREWNRSGLQDCMTPGTAKLLLAAILDNTLNLTSSNTTEEDKEAFAALCAHAGVGEDFRAAYFSEVQRSVECDLRNALLGDMKSVRDNPVLPPKVAQLCVWNATGILARLDEIRGWFTPLGEPWMINIMDLSQNCGFFVCDDRGTQRMLESVFEVSFESGIARTSEPYLRKQIIRNTLDLMNH